MKIYLLFYIIIFTPFLFFSLEKTFFKNHIDETNAFYLLSIIILNFSLPIFFFIFKSYSLASLLALLDFGFVVMLAQRIFKNNLSSLFYLVPTIGFYYYTFCFMLAVNLMN